MPKGINHKCKKGSLLQAIDSHKGSKLVATCFFIAHVYGKGTRLGLCFFSGIAFLGLSLFKVVYFNWLVVWNMCYFP